MCVWLHNSCFGSVAQHKFIGGITRFETTDLSRTEREDAKAHVCAELFHEDSEGLNPHVKEDAGKHASTNL